MVALTPGVSPLCCGKGAMRVEPSSPLGKSNATFVMVEDGREAPPIVVGANSMLGLSVVGTGSLEGGGAAMSEMGGLSKPAMPTLFLGHAFFSPGR